MKGGKVKSWFVYYCVIRVNLTIFSTAINKKMKTTTNKNKTKVGFILIKGIFLKLKARFRIDFINKFPILNFQIVFNKMDYNKKRLR